MLRLSDAYAESAASEGLSGLLELEVRVVNINFGHNEEMVRKCGDLNGYVALTTKIRSYQSEGINLNEAVSQAIRDCVNENILVEFIKAHGTEAIGLMSLVYDADLEKQVIREEAIEEGEARGEARGKAIGFLSAAQKLLESGLNITAVSDMLGIPPSDLQELHAK